jgi:hypothetical protein
MRGVPFILFAELGSCHREVFGGGFTLAGVESCVRSDGVWYYSECEVVDSESRQVNGRLNVWIECFARNNAPKAAVPTVGQMSQTDNSRVLRLGTNSPFPTSLSSACAQDDNRQNLAIVQGF